MDINKNQRYSTKEIDDCIGMLTHMVNNNEEFVALPREKTNRTDKNCRETIQTRLSSVETAEQSPS